MEDDPTSPGTNGEAEPGEDGGDVPDDGADGRGDGPGGQGTARGQESAEEHESAEDHESGEDRGAADDQGVDDDGEVGDAQESTDDRGATEDHAATDGPPGETGGGRAAAVDAAGGERTAAASGGRGGATAADADADAVGDDVAADAQGGGAAGDGSSDVPADVRKYERFTKVDGAQYDRVNEFLRERTYVTAREWAMARLCADFRTETGVEMTKIGENLPELVPFMEDTYSPQAVNQARSSFEEKVQKAGATFLYGAMCDFFTAEELDELMYEVTEVAKFLLEVEGVDLTVEEELEAEDRISGIMREVREASEALRYEECPHCGEHLRE